MSDCSEDTKMTGEMVKRKYYHGGYGRLKVHDLVLPPSVTGAPSCADFGAAHVCRRDRVYLTTSLEDASLIATFHPSGAGRVYEVFPIGDLEPDPDCTVPGLSFQVARARVCKVMSITQAYNEAVGVGRTPWST